MRLGISRLVVVGEGARPLHLAASIEGRGDRSVWVPDATAAISQLASVAAPGDVVLVKASRAAGLEEVAEALLDETETGA
jgi:UDP-N-acetylmuramoyl-tripeptide--D-alanyl-D-alanine ligase